MLKQEKREHYVYQYLREDGSPYYIGKGKKNRKTDSHGKIPVPSNPDRIVILHKNLTDKEAIDIEIALIAKYGRKDKGTGILRNMTDGGQGHAGRITSKETRQKLSEALTGKKMPAFSKEHREKLSQAKRNSKGNNSGKKHSERTKNILSAQRKGKSSGPVSNETRSKISKALKNKQHSKQHSSACAAGHMRKCTVDGTTVFESVTELIKALGQGKSGRRAPTFTFI